MITNENSIIKMTNKKSKVGKVPNLRFPGFEGEWETKKLGEVATFSKGKGISKSDIDLNGITECIRYGELYTHYGEAINEIKSRTNANTSNLVLSEANDVIIPASGETTIDIATASCVLKSGVALGGDLNIIKSTYNGLFLAYYLNSKKKLAIANLAQGISVVHLYTSQLASLSLNLPEKKEQNKISAFLALHDQRIQTQNKIIEQLETLMRGFTNKLFNQQKRFKNKIGKDYSEWELKKLDLVLIKNSNKNKGQKHSLVQSVSNEFGFINQDEMFEDRQVASKDTSNYYVINKGHFAYNPSRIDVGSLAYKSDNETSVISPLYISFRANNSFIRDYYLLNWFSSQQFLKQMNKSFEGSVRNTLSYESLTKMTISIPSLDEQTFIIDFLSSIKQKIQTEKAILEQLEKQKKYLLQQIFI